MIVVPYQSTPPALMGLLSGTVQVFFGNVSDVMELVQSGKGRLLAAFNGETCTAIPGHPDGFRNHCGISDDWVDRLLRADWYALLIIDGVVKVLVASLASTNP